MGLDGSSNFVLTGEASPFCLTKRVPRNPHELGLLVNIASNCRSSNTIGIGQKFGIFLWLSANHSVILSFHEQWATIFPQEVTRKIITFWLAVQTYRRRLNLVVIGGKCDGDVSRTFQPSLYRQDTLFALFVLRFRHHAQIIAKATSRATATSDVTTLRDQISTRMHPSSH